MNLKKTISLLLSAVLAAGSLIAAPVLPEGASLFAAPILAEAAGAVSSGTTNSTISYQKGTSTLYFEKISSGTQVALCGSTLSQSNTFLEIPESFTVQGRTYTITRVNAGAFQNQTNLASVYFKGNSLSNIGAFAFKGCTNMNLCSYYGTIQSIGNNAFENCKAMEFCTLPENAQEIGYNAFKNCIKLSSLMLHNVNVLRGSAFYGCKGLEKVTFDVAVSVSVIEYRTFADCTNLKTISLPETVRLIEENAFQNCSSMEKAYIPDSVTEIRSYAFYNCSKLKTVMMSENIRFIASYAFYNCNAMKYFVCKNTTATIGSYAAGYHKENGAKVKNSGFVIWGRGGSAQNYAQNNGMQYKDVSAAPAEASERYTAFEWRKTNTANNWGKNGKVYFNNAHLPYANGKNGETFEGICYGLAAVSALTSSGYLSVSDYAPGYSHIHDITTISDNLKSYVSTVYANAVSESEYFTQEGRFGKEFLRYAEYTTYGADAGLFLAYRDPDLGHGLVCFGLEFKENASDRNTNSLWNGKDARLMLYDVNYAVRDCNRYVYVNLTDGSWYWNGQSVFQHYNPETCFFKMKHMFDGNIVRYGWHGFTSISAFFDAIRNPQ